MQKETIKENIIEAGNIVTHEINLPYAHEEENMDSAFRIPEGIELMNRIQEACIHANKQDFNASEFGEYIEKHFSKRELTFLLVQKMNNPF